MFWSKPISDGDNNARSVGSEFLADGMGKRAGRATEDESTAMEIDNGGQFGGGGEGDFREEDANYIGGSRIRGEIFGGNAIDEGRLRRNKGTVGE